MHLCPGCLEAGQTKGKIQQLENRRVIYDNIALALAALSLPSTRRLDGHLST